MTWLAGTLPLGALWLVYRLALRGERCFGYNRAFLLLVRLATRRLRAPAYSSLLQPFTLTRIAMLHNQDSGCRWKQWLVLPVLGGLFFRDSHAALAQGGPVPSEAQQKATRDDIRRKVRVAMHQDSLRTGGKLEPGTMQQVNSTKMNGKQGAAVVTVTRVPVPPAPPQPTTSSGEKVFGYVEQMPQLPGGGGQLAIVQAIQNKLVYPAGEKTEGRVFVKFTIAADGVVHDTKISRGLTPALDAAALAAVKQVPQFEPGKQSGKPVAVSFTVPIQFQAKP